MFSYHQKSERPCWIYPEEDPEWRDAIVREFKIHPVTAQVLVSRGFKTLDDIHHYLYAKLPDLHDPFLMPEMVKAVDRICEAIQQGHPILIYGDNDVDGITGTALLTEFLQFVGANVFFYLSQRSPLRGSIIVEALEYAKKTHCKLMITVDCGITASTEILEVVKEGVDVIITDHHEPTHTLPQCTAILNPKLPNNEYPNKDLTGVGVAFKFAHAVTNRLVNEGILPPRKVDLKRYLDLVALGTIADMGPLIGENRIFVRYGLKQLKRSKRIGLLKLFSVSDYDVNDVNTYGIVTKIAPRLNSLGRIDDPEKGVELLLVRNTQTAEKMAKDLDLNNIERQKIERVMSLDIEEMVHKDPALLKGKTIIMQSDKWHPGIIAIISTRFCKQYNRPTIMISVENGIGKGSLRSIPEFPLLTSLKDCSELLLNYGGHDFAAGLMIKEENIEEFKKRFNASAEAKLTDTDVLPKLKLDAFVKFEDITFDFMESLSLLEPYGNENPQPILYTDAKQAWPPKVIGKTHLKFYLSQKDKMLEERMLEGIAFGRAVESSLLRRKDLTLRVAFTPQINQVVGPSIQLMIRDFQVM